MKIENNIKGKSLFRISILIAVVILAIPIYFLGAFCQWVTEKTDKFGNHLANTIVPWAHKRFDE